MKIYTNELHEIVAIGHSTNPALACHELPDDESNFFQGKCDAFILGYRYRVEDGTTEISPYKSYHILDSIQAQWEADKGNSDMMAAELTMAMAEMQNNADMAVAELTMAMASMMGGGADV